MKKLWTKHVPAPVELWDPGAVEQWLEDEAAKGWRLYSCGTRLARLEQAKPEVCRVRLHPRRNEDWARTRERQAAYEEMGWHFAAELQEYEVYYCADPAAPELETDPLAQQWAWEKVLKRSRRSGWVCLTLIALMAVAVPWMLWRVEDPVRSFLQAGWMVCAAALLLAPDAVGLMRQMRGIRRVRRQLQAGVPLEHSGNWRRMRRRAMLSLVSTWMLWVLLLVMNVILPMLQNRSMPLETVTDPLPYVAAEELDGRFDPAQRRYGYVSRERAVLMPLSYHIWEYFPEQTRVETTYDRVLFPVLTGPLYREMLSAQMALWPEAEQTGLTEPGFDEAVLLEYGQMQYFLARKGRAVFSVWTNGGAELSDDMEKFAVVLTDFQ